MRSRRTRIIDTILSLIVSALLSQSHRHIIDSQPLQAPLAYATPVPQAAAPVVQPSTISQPAGNPIGILARIAQCESGTNYTKYNSSGSGASGAYQIMPGTWNGYGGYRNAADAPPATQDQFARNLYAARGTEPWNASRSCWS